jgi:hypothetical protein
MSETPVTPEQPLTGLAKPPAREMKKGFRFESYSDYVMGLSDDGYDYEEEVDDGEPPLSPKTVQRIIDSVWNKHE